MGTQLLGATGQLITLILIGSEVSPEYQRVQTGLGIHVLTGFRYRLER